ncbi:hypothetical protein TRFO_09018 [Tritrichomonas foetus]|uniref:KATNIP domain-containing protein n=1 Tax=Tritrichomonas foetus TaxID=1144522 RepID=A0A1J4JG40_9EUKA|nr:hypothetical protein TRFO_09018 [Tritrichomonas foetus]|eukprot:OHS98166.1 hypothetical protein TRFO_09018 [Tritrichomonas foetus]
MISRTPSQKLPTIKKSVMASLSERNIRRSLELKEEPIVTNYIGEKSGLDISGLIENATDPKQVVQIKIFSNWGHPDTINLSSINIMRETFKVPVMTAGTIPVMNDPSTLSNLFNNSMIKSENEEVWKHSWPIDEDRNSYLSIILIVPYGEKITLIRVWNPDHDKTANTKDIEIFIGDLIVYKGVIPQRFGIDCAIPKDFYHNNISEVALKSAKEAMNSVCEINPPADSFGFFHMPKVFSITFEITETYSFDSFFGINGIDIFDHDLNLITNDDIRKLNVSGCDVLNDKRTLFRPNKITNTQDFMFIGERHEKETPKIEVTLKNLSTVALIIVWNYNYNHNTDFYRGIKHIKILLGPKRVVRALVKKANGEIYQCIDNATYIWLTDYPQTHSLFNQLNLKRRQIEFEEDMNQLHDSR